MPSEFFENTVDHLKSLVTRFTQESWDFYQAHPVEHKKFKPALNTFEPKKLRRAIPNENGYLTFEKGLKLAWFYQKITFVQQGNSYDISGLHARLNLTWWAEITAIFVNGELVCEGDLFDSSTRLLLSENAQINQTFDVAIALVSPGHDIGALMKSELIFESPTLEKIEAGSFAIELQVLGNYLEHWEPQKITEIEKQLKNIPWNLVAKTQEFNQALAIIRQQIIPFAQPIRERKFHVLGHAHLDMAWLWTTEETWEVGQRTFQSVLNLQQEFPELIFGHSTPALYDWIEANRPDLWEKIQQAVDNYSWELLGGMWVEPEVNLVSGESIIRQFLYGQQYFLEKFGRRSTVAWLPDTFGFPNQLPQLAKHCDIKAFGTGKLHWNDTNPFPYGLFWWRSPDGTDLLTFMTPPNVTGIMDTNPITMTNYACKWEKQTGLKDIFWLPGVGDHGGGPTKDMLQIARKWQQSPFFPKLEFSRAENYLDCVKETPDLPIWQDELYLELHRGCYTVHRDQKVFNNHCETLLRQVEIWSAIACNLPHTAPPDFHIAQHQLKDLWKKTLFNQFHDILPGTAIPEVFTEANQQWQAVINTSEAMLSQSLKAIAAQISYDCPLNVTAKPLLLFNDLNWERTEIISLSVPDLVTVYDWEGNKVNAQIIVEEIQTDRSYKKYLSFLARVPSVGYTLYWLCPDPQAPTQREEDLFNEPEFTLENDFLRVEINPKTGDIDRFFDKVNSQEILTAPGNQLQAFTDKGQYWDAWDIAPDYEANPVEPIQLLAVQWREKNAVRSVIRVTKKLDQSTFIQDYQLDCQGKILKIYSTVDWQAKQVVLKTAFPFAIDDATCTYETPCGALERKPNLDPAKWEVPALRWADFHNQDYGISLLTKNHHGYDVTQDQLRLTLLKSPLWPDPTADRGTHHLAYAIYPHRGLWQTAQTVNLARNFNSPLRAVVPDSTTEQNYLLPCHSFMDLGADNLVLLALKKAESDQGYILRLYEAYGQGAEFSCRNTLGLTVTEQVNGLEDTLTKTIDDPIKPWKVRSYRLEKLSHFNNE
ncbi:alpha-mannosidase [Synechococcus moorigangaii CMS01]|nr:alpha-mannosidase [Synechococcus moorigangaii CMS01]